MAPELEVGPRNASLAGAGRRVLSPSREERSSNDELRQARLRLPSPSGLGRPTSRQRLADVVNAYLWNNHRLRERLDEKDTGKLERGEDRWPGGQEVMAIGWQLTAFQHRLAAAAMSPALAARSEEGL